MPRQITGIVLNDYGNGTVGVQMGMREEIVQLTDLLDHTQTDEEQVRQNCRLAFLVGGYAQPNSDEFVRGVNRVDAGQNGMEGRAGRVKIDSVTLIDQTTQRYAIWFTYKTGPHQGEQFGVEMTIDDFKADTLDQSVVIKNINSFLRIGNHGQLTQGAKNAVRNASFWY